MNPPEKEPIATLETTDALQAQRLERDLAANGVSYTTEITKTKRDGLRYVIRLLSPTHET